MSQITLDDLKHFWMPSGVPCFVADRNDICDVVEGMGFQIYYLISNQAIEIKPVAQPNKPATSYNSSAIGYGSTTYYNNTSSYTAPQQPKIERKPQLFKVVNNFVGRSVSVSTDSFPEQFIDVQEECAYLMPLIPRKIIDKLDEFFRLVHSQHGTESIVILTYDTNKTDSSGWGVLVPEQTNTPAHCKYDADSIAAIKPDDVLIVGSVHSHPEMSAYASGTDHEDQADFDGIHITYGWQNSVQNGATQYHIELQMSGKHYKLDIEDVFEPFQIDKDPDPEVVEWSGKVKKALPPQQGGSTHSVQQPLTPSYLQPQNQPSTHLTRTGTRAGASKKLLNNVNYLELLEELKLPKNALIMVEVDINGGNSFHCPACECEISSTNLTVGCCDICGIPLVSPEDGMPTVCDKAEDYIFENYLSYSIPVYFFGKDTSGNPIVMRINEEIDYYRNSFTSNINSKKSNLAYNDYDDSDYVYVPTSDSSNDHSIFDNDGQYLICCGVKVSHIGTDCFCETPIFLSDLLDFDEKIKDHVQMYQNDSQCHTCAYYYEPKCPAYREILTEYTRNSYSFNISNYANSISGCSNYTYYRDVSVSVRSE